MNHRWKDLTEPLGQKHHRCVKCGIERYWEGGYFQGWEYMDLKKPPNRRTTFIRPDCIPPLTKEEGREG